MSCLLTSFSFLTCFSLCALQRVSASTFPTFSLSMFWYGPPLILFGKQVPLVCWLSFHTLTCLFLGALQFVSTLLYLSWYTNLSFPYLHQKVSLSSIFAFSCIFISFYFAGSLLQTELLCCWGTFVIFKFCLCFTNTLSATPFAKQWWDTSPTNWYFSPFFFGISDIQLSQIAMAIILEHACLLYVSQHGPSREEALDKAYSQYKSSNLQNAVRKQFSAPPIQYPILQFTEFILGHRLWWPVFPLCPIASSLMNTFHAICIVSSPV